jgi:hypothetical protein
MSIAAPSIRWMKEWLCHRPTAIRSLIVFITVRRPIRSWAVRSSSGPDRTSQQQSLCRGTIPLAHSMPQPWGAERASGKGRGLIYVVEPTAAFEDDPNLTEKTVPRQFNPVLLFARAASGRRRGLGLAAAHARLASADEERPRSSQRRGEGRHHRLTGDVRHLGGAASPSSTIGLAPRPIRSKLYARSLGMAPDPHVERTPSILDDNTNARSHHS